ncbi:DUF2243 domain-containing protein [Cellulomonas cellasea]|uniref:DUF2243 domain-containing protein n=1 Tax=Cellulomonas cellasea TaxID=43670 RepID=A0A4Y3L2D8_9CELL|nr:DUF2243 domain-containing protein [Cellulomonas cellasea]GEA89330.1 hypothetical protein CCE01nite_32790 [Cellulomonas cellasea]
MTAPPPAAPPPSGGTPAGTRTVPTDPSPPPHDTRRSLGAGAMIGVGLMAAVDEIVFHQLLGWHHFYDRSTSQVALLSDGVLHAVELVLLVAGFFVLADLQRRRTLARGFVQAGLLVGAGGFQLFDGLVDHKVLRVHQVRYGVELLPYDVAWNGVGALVLVAGLVVLARARRRARAAAGR